MTEPLIAMSKVCKHYQLGKSSVPVLTNLDMNIMKGEFVGIMGPSGSGKSTTLNLLGGLDKPDSGTISVAGKHVNEMSQASLTRWRAQEVGFVFQAYNLLPILSARHNVELPLLLTRLSRTQRKMRTEAALELVGLGERVNHRPSELSGGQQQRVAIARAIVTDPSFLVCDEPTGDLDRNSANEILELLQLLKQKQNKTIVMVTHDPKAAEYADRIVMMDKGRISPEEVATCD